MKNSFNLQPLTGMVELTPAEQLQFERWKTIVADTYALYGFSPLDTPVIERSEILFAKAGEGTAKQIYRFTKGDTDMSLRFDLTVPLARYVAQHQNDLTFPFRRQAIGKVYRGERAQRGRYREFYQADADIVGRGDLDLKYDGEILSLVVAVMEQLNLGDFQLQINNRKLITGFLQAMKIMDVPAVIALLDAADKIGPDKLKSELGLLRLNGLEVRKIINFAGIRGNFAEFSQALLRLDIDNSEFEQGLEELQVVAESLQALGVESQRYQFNTAIVRGLDYYTGTIYETTLLVNPQLGSISSGGRYDNLVGNFAKTKMPGVGCSIGLTRLFTQALALGLVATDQRAVAQVVVLPLTERMDQVLAIAHQLRQAGIKTDIYLQEAGLNKKMTYAHHLGVKWALIIGDDEIDSGKISAKNMVTGSQALLSVGQVIDLIQEDE